MFVFLTCELTLESGKLLVADALAPPAVAGVVALVVVPLKVGAALDNFLPEKNAENCSLRKDAACSKQSVGELNYAKKLKILLPIPKAFFTLVTGCREYRRVLGCIANNWKIF